MKGVAAIDRLIEVAEKRRLDCSQRQRLREYLQTSRHSGKDGIRPVVHARLVAIHRILGLTPAHAVISTHTDGSVVTETDAPQADVLPTPDPTDVLDLAFIDAAIAIVLRRDLTPEEASQLIAYRDRMAVLFEAEGFPDIKPVALLGSYFRKPSFRAEVGSNMALLRQLGMEEDTSDPQGYIRYFQHVADDSRQLVAVATPIHAEVADSLSALRMPRIVAPLPGTLPICVQFAGGQSIELYEYFKAYDRAEKSVGTHRQLLQRKILSLLQVEPETELDKIQLGAARLFPRNPRLFSLLVQDLTTHDLMPNDKCELQEALRVQGKPLDQKEAWPTGLKFVSIGSTDDLPKFDAIGYLKAVTFVEQAEYRYDKEYLSLLARSLPVRFPSMTTFKADATSDGTITIVAVGHAVLSVDELKQLADFLIRHGLVPQIAE